MKSKFLKSMSKELRTPLHAILGFAKMMEQDKNISNVHKKSFEVIITNGEKLLEKITEILHYTEIESNKFKIHFEQFAFTSFLQQIVESTKKNVVEKKLEFKYDVSDELAQIVYGDYKRLKQVLLNIIDNAIKFTEKGGIEFRVKKILHNNYVEGEGLEMIVTSSLLIRFEIEDSGIGMTKDESEKAFKAFWKKDMSDFSEGMGLGLTISRDIVRRMGGEINIESEINRGTKVWFEIEVPIILSQCDE